MGKSRGSQFLLLTSRLTRSVLLNHCRRLNSLFIRVQKGGFSFLDCLFTFMKKTNPRLMHNLMMNNMKQYRTQIFEENDDFFAEKINELEQF